MFKIMISDLLEKLMNFTYTQIEMDSIDYPDLVYNEIEQFKSGGKIHIKKKNRGKFTEYCGGKVTNECIARGKASSNPAIRKRATFAANARRWHKK